MKLIEMSFEDSRNAELVITPEIEKIMSDEVMRKSFDNLFITGNKKELRIKRGAANKAFSHNLIASHYESICIILGAMNHISVDEVKKQTRGQVNDQLAEILNDGDLISFFMSPEALDMITQSAT